MWYIVFFVQSRKKEEEDKLAEVMEGKNLYAYLHDVVLPSHSNVNLIRQHAQQLRLATQLGKERS